MLEITFKYCDAYSNGKWNTQHCVVESIRDCIEIYGLNESDVDYEIISVEEV